MFAAASRSHNRRRVQLRSLTPDQCQEMVAAGDWVLVDVRPADDFAKASPEGAFNVPLFQQVNFSQATPKSLLRAAAYMFNGVKPVEPNPTFLEDLETVADGKGVIMVRAGHPRAIREETACK